MIESEGSDSDEDYVIERVPPLAKRPRGRPPKKTNTTSPVVRSTRKHRRIPESEDEEDDGSVYFGDEHEEDEEDDVVPIAKRPRGRPPKNTPSTPDPPLFSASYDEAVFSLTLEKRGAHLPMVWFHSVSDYLDTKSELYDCSTEVGPKAGNLHLQCVFVARCLTDVASIKKIVMELKGACNTRWGDGSKIFVCLKELVAGQTLSRVIGYIRKDRNLATFNNRNKNVTEAMISTGIKESQAPSTHVLFDVRSMHTQCVRCLPHTHTHTHSHTLSLTHIGTPHLELHS